jgi:hypothetical protein
LMEDAHARNPWAADIGNRTGAEQWCSPEKPRSRHGGDRRHARAGPRHYFPVSVKA